MIMFSVTLPFSHQISTLILENLIMCPLDRPFVIEMSSWNLLCDFKEASTWYIMCTRTGSKNT